VGKGWGERSRRKELLQLYHCVNPFRLHKGLRRISRFLGKIMPVATMIGLGYFFSGYLATAGHCTDLFFLIKPFNVMVKREMKDFSDLKKDT
jgi:hypothetical protein